MQKMSAKNETANAAKSANAANEVKANALNDAQGILSANLDTLNDAQLIALLEKRKISNNAIISAKNELYCISGYNKHFNCSIVKLDKNARNKIRAMREKLINAIIANAANADKNALNEAIIAFKAFYAAIYKNAKKEIALQDIIAKNANVDLIANAKIALHLIAKQESKK